jgi:MSHA biogenesis protein MshJ
VKERWQKLAARFNALAHRERALVFVAALAGAVLVFHALALDPLLARKQRLARELAETRQNIRIADAQLKAAETRADPDAVRRSYRDALRKQLAEIDASMQGLQAGLVAPERMAKLLEEMVGRSRGVLVTGLRTLPTQRFENPVAPSGPASGKDPKPAPPEPERSIYQHSVEVSLRGSYADLHDYLAHLERSPLRMFWGRLHLDSAQPPGLTVTLTVHTLSLSKAWLVV